MAGAEQTAGLRQTVDVMMMITKTMMIIMSRNILMAILTVPIRYLRLQLAVVHGTRVA